MYRIKALNEIAEEGMGLLTDKYKIVQGEEYDGIILRSFKLHDVEYAKDLKAIARAGAGVNNIPIEKCSEDGIVVFNTPGANANAVKELVLAGLFLSSREVTESITWAKTLKEEEDVAKKVEKNKSKFAGPEIMGKTLGVIGLGAIGALVANSAVSLGMKVIGYDPFISVDAAWGLKSKVQKATSMDELLEASDYITVHVPLMEETKGMINTELISKMKDGVRVLNFSRGGLVDDASIEMALKEKKVSKYITDFPNEKTIGMEGVVAIPHLGASTPESETNCAIMAVNEIMDYLENGNITNSVNYPSCDFGKCQAPARIAINHKNVPNMIGQVTSVLAGGNINIKDMLNKSKNEWAYTLIDTDSGLDEDVVTKLNEIDGVCKVRVLTK